MRMFFPSNYVVYVNPVASRSSFLHCLELSDAMPGLRPLCAVSRISRNERKIFIRLLLLRMCVERRLDKECDKTVQCIENSI